MENITYEKFINNILETRGRFACGDEYHERHHILPRCMQGTNDEENLIDLFAREHFIAHKLLAEENPDNDKLVYAYTCMAFLRNDYEHRHELSPEEYEEAKSTLCKIATGEGNPFYGRHHTNETKNVISKVQSIPVVQLGLDGRYIAEFKSGREASEITGVNETTINKCCLGKSHYKSGGKFIWVYKKDYDPHNDITYDNNTLKPVVQLDKLGNFIAEYNTIRDASINTNICDSNITMCCKGNYRHAGEYIWIYKAEYDPSKTYVYKNPAYKEVVQIDTNGNIITTYESIVEASKTTGIKSSTISRCLAKDGSMAGGFIWKYADEDYDLDKIKSTNYHKSPVKLPVLQYDLDGNFISEYKSVADAVRNTNVSKTRILECCHGVQEKTKGFVFRWKTE